jgi:hypothetical protein
MEAHAQGHALVMRVLCSSDRGIPRPMIDSLAAFWIAGLDSCMQAGTAFVASIPPYHHMADGLAGRHRVASVAQVGCPEPGSRCILLVSLPGGTVGLLCLTCGSLHAGRMDAHSQGM